MGCDLHMRFRQIAVKLRGKLRFGEIKSEKTFRSRQTHTGANCFPRLQRHETLPEWNYTIRTNCRVILARSLTKTGEPFRAAALFTETVGGSHASIP